MKKKTKLYLRLNLLSLFFVAVSFISVTLAWFVYTGLSRVTTEVAVKAWYIELEKNGESVSNNVVISLDDIYPGMEPIEEEIKIKNFGDSDASVKYEILSARILGDEEDNYILSETMTSNFIEDQISHEYPFHINISLSKRYVLAKTDEATFKVSISWPLDSGDDALDSLWGTKAYKFKLAEQEQKSLDKDYQIRASIKLDISLTAEQYIETPEVSDPKYRLGNEVLYDVSENKVCETEGTTCIRTNVIDVNNTLCDSTITLLPKVTQNYTPGKYNEINGLYQSYVTSWNATTRLLNIGDVLNVVSRDLKGSVIVRPNISDLVIGNLSYEGRLEKVLLKVTQPQNQNQGYFKFLNKYSYFYSDSCYWLNSEYDLENSFAVQTLDENSMQISGVNKSETCKFIPVIIGNKPNYNTTLCGLN